MPFHGGGFFGGGGGPRRDDGPRRSGGGFNFSFGGGGPRRRPPRDDHHRHHGPGLGHGVRFFHGPIRFRFFGRPIFISTGRQIGFIAGFIALFVMIISTFAMFTGLKTSKEDVKYYEKEYAYILADSQMYLDIINKARAGEIGYEIGTGYFEYKYATTSSPYAVYDYDYYYGTYYISFTLEVEAGQWKQFDTYAMYNNTAVIGNQYEDALRDIDPNSKWKAIEVAYTKVNGLWVAINTDYDGTVNYEIEAFKLELEDAKDSVKTYTISVVILIGIAVIIVLIVKTLKSNNNLKMQKLKQKLKKLKQRQHLLKNNSIEREDSVNIVVLNLVKMIQSVQIVVQFNMKLENKLKI